MEVNIRRGNEADFPQILSLIKALARTQGTPEKVKISLPEMIENKLLFQCYVAETAEQTIVGFASFYLAYYSWSGKAMYLDDLFVTDEFRNRGIGKRLLETVIGHAKKERCVKLRWQVAKWNTNAIRFYKAMGAGIDEVEINCDLLIAKD